MLHAGPWSVDGLALRPTEAKIGIFDNEPNPAEELWGLYLSRALPSWHTHVDLYYLGFDHKSVRYVQGTGREHRETIGTRVWSHTPTWDYDFEYGPTALGLVLQVWLALRLPAGMDQQLVWGMVVASLTGMFSTLVLQLPLHRAFNRSGASPELLRKLLRTDWIRKTADAVRLAATAIVLRQLLILR
jgi:hypothetical protein